MSVERTGEANIIRVRAKEILGHIASEPFRTKIAKRLEHALISPLKLLEGKDAPEWRKNLAWREKLVYEGQQLLAPVLMSVFYLVDKLTSLKSQTPYSSYYSEANQSYLLSNSVDITVGYNQPCDLKLHQNN